MPILNKHNFSIADIAAQEKGRYAINGVYVSKEFTAATDGRSLAIMTLPEQKDDAPFEPFIMRVEVSKRLAQTAKRRVLKPGSTVKHCKVETEIKVRSQKFKPVVKVEGDEVSTLFRIDPVEGIFPRVASIIPTESKEDASVFIHVRRLVAISKQLQSFTRDAEFGSDVAEIRLTKKGLIVFKAARPDLKQNLTIATQKAKD